MKKLKQMIESSFSLRMSLYILMMAASVFILAFWGYFQQARRSVREEAMVQAQVKLDNTILQIDKVLGSVETAVQNLSWLVADKLDYPDYMYALTQQVLRSNPHVVGSAIAFEPSYYPGKEASSWVRKITNITTWTGIRFLSCWENPIGVNLIMMTGVLI